MNAGIEVRRLLESDTVDALSSGSPALDSHLRQYAKQNQRRGMSATWLAVEGQQIAGYVTLVTGSVERSLLDHVRPKLPLYPVPALLLARMATDRDFRGRGVGRRLMRVVFQEAVALAERTGCAGVSTDAKPADVEIPDAAGFYARFDFVVVRRPSEANASTGMFLALAEIRRQLARP